MGVFSVKRAVMPGWWLKMGALLACTSLGCAGGSEQGTREPFMRIVSPQASDVLSGGVPLQLEYELPPGVQSIELGVDDQSVPLRSLTGAFTLQSANYPDGTHTLSARVTDDRQQVWQDAVVVSFDNPDHRLEANEFSAAEYRAGDQVQLSLKYSEDVQVQADFSALDAAFAPGSVALQPSGPGEYAASYQLSSNRVAEDGEHSVVVTATADNGDQTRDELLVTLKNTPDIPVEVDGAIFVPGPPPQIEKAVPQGLRVSEVSGDPNLITGGGTDLLVAWEQPAEAPVTQVQLSAPGFGGYYALPIDPQPGATGQVTLPVKLPALKPGFSGGELQLLASVVNAAGSVSGAPKAANVIPVGGGGLQLTLEWNSAADMDLSVITPAKNLLDFETPMVDGGALDLDSNAICMSNNVNKENISWPPGTEPQGSYEVRVNLFDACSAAQATWKITAKYCGKVETFTGSSSAADADDTGTGQAVKTLTVNCDHVVQGAVTYAKKKAAAPTQAATGTSFVKVSAAPVRAVTEATPPITLAQGVTDRDGNYKLQFSNPSNADWHVEVDASWVEPGGTAVRALVVEPGRSDPYRFKSPVILASAPKSQTQNLRIRVQDQSGAFNIRDIVRRGFEWVATNAGAPKAKSLPQLPAEWKAGVTPAAGTSNYNAGKFFVLGSAADSDEFDDPVLAHEFQHFVVETLTRSGPGGTHSGRVAPAIAYDEGIATAFGLDVLKLSVFRDETAAGVSTDDIENLATGFTGTAGNTRSGNVNEFLIAAFLHDMLDPSNEPQDKLQDRANTFWTEFDWMAGSSFVDRDSNGADLVDFIDGYSSRTQGGQDGALKCLADQLKFPYDFVTGTACPP